MTEEQLDLFPQHNRRAAKRFLNRHRPEGDWQFAIQDREIRAGERMGTHGERVRERADAERGVEVIRNERL